MNRRDWLRRTTVGAIGGFGFPQKSGQAETLRSARLPSNSKLDGTKIFTTACNFCSCGCGMLCYVKDGELIDLEGDSGHVVNEGALCSKGAAMIAAHKSDRRIRQPLYRAPGSDHWQTISWDEALDKVARKMKKTRDDFWIEKETAKDASGKEAEYVVNRCDAFAFLGGAQNTNEECYLMTKMSRLLGTVQVEHQARL
jgi:formate dehydrogenase major subunit